MGSPAPAGPRVVRCRSCGALVFWATWSTSGKALLVDAEPNELGNVLLVRRGDAFLASRFRAELEAPGRNRWTPHFATCPHASSHRRPR